METPFVSVIIPAYNVVKEYFYESIQSILNQTYQNFELIIIDDGSDIPVSEMLKDFNNQKIVLLRNDKNSGLPFTLNRGLDLAKGKYVFRMDSDDICFPERLEKQIDFFEKHENVDILGTYAITFGEYKTIFKSSQCNEDIKAELLWKNPIVHPSVAFRTSAIREKNLYYNSDYASEDYSMWIRCAFEKDCCLAVLPEVLLKYRVHGNQITTQKRDVLRESEKKILENIFKRLNIEISKKEVDLYCCFRNEDNLSFLEIKSLISVLKRIYMMVPMNVSNKKVKSLFRKNGIKYCIKNKKIISLIYFLMFI